MYDELRNWGSYRHNHLLRIYQHDVMINSDFFHYFACLVSLSFSIQLFNSIQGSAYSPWRFYMNGCTVGNYESYPTGICLSAYHTFFTMFLSLYHHYIFGNSKHWQTWCPCRRSSPDVKSQIQRCQSKFPLIWAFPDHNSSLNSQRATKWCTYFAVA